MTEKIYVLTILFTQTLFGQIIFEPTFINQCTGKIEDNVYWHLTNSDSLFIDDNSNFKTITLPKLGKYQLYLELDKPPIDINITKNGINKDTILLKRLNLTIYVSNPPHSEYFDCEQIANGKVIDKYHNGNIRMKGVFKNGQPIDSLFSYYHNGQLSRLFVPNKKHWKSTKYFNDGNIKSIFNTKKHYNKEYYPSGKLKQEEYWGRRRNRKVTQYFQNGITSKYTERKKQEVFDKNGNLIELFKRKEILVLQRIFAKTYYDRHNRFYEYTWKTFDSDRIIQRQIIFNNSDFSAGPFPDSIQQINHFLFEKVIFYQKGQEFKKIETQYFKENNEYIRKLLIFRKENEKWIEEKRMPSENIHKIITTNSN